VSQRPGIAEVWLLGVLILSATAVFHDSLVSAVLAVAYAVVMHAFAVKRAGGGS